MDGAFGLRIGKTDFLRELVGARAAGAFERVPHEGDSVGTAAFVAAQCIAKLQGMPVINYPQYHLFNSLLGLPSWLVKIFDAIFDGMTPERAVDWPVRFVEAINEGADLDGIGVPVTMLAVKKGLEVIECSYQLQFSPPPVLRSVLDAHGSLRKMLVKGSGSLDFCEVVLNDALNDLMATRDKIRVEDGHLLGGVIDAVRVALNVCRTAQGAIYLVPRGEVRQFVMSTVSGNYALDVEKFADELLDIIRSAPGGVSGQDRAPTTSPVYSFSSPSSSSSSSSSFPFPFPLTPGECEGGAQSRADTQHAYQVNVDLSDRIDALVAKLTAVGLKVKALTEERDRYRNGLKKIASPSSRRSSKIMRKIARMALKQR